MEEEVTKVLTAELYRVLKADDYNKIKGIVSEAVAAANAASAEAVAAANDAEAHYAGAVYLTQEEYDQLTTAQKLDPTKVYFIEEEDESESE